VLSFGPACLHGYYIRRGGLTLDAKIDVRFVFDKWSGARDLNPGPHGPELCELSSRNVGNDRFRFGLSAKEAGCIVIQGYSPAGLLHEVLHRTVIRSEHILHRSTAAANERKLSIDTSLSSRVSDPVQPWLSQKMTSVRNARNTMFRHVWPAMVMTTLPRACPASR